MILAKDGFAKHCVWKVLRHAVLYLGVLLSWGLVLLVDASAQESSFSAGAFVTTWETRSNNESIIIPTTGSGYNYNVDCNNDGTNELTGQTGDATCTYATPGTHTVVITGAFPRIFFDGGSGKNKIRSVAQWGTQMGDSGVDFNGACVSSSRSKCG